MGSKSFYREDIHQEIQRVVLCLKSANGAYVLVPGKNYYVSYGDYDSALKEAEYQVSKGFKLKVGEVQ